MTVAARACSAVAFVSLFLAVSGHIAAAPASSGMTKSDTGRGGAKTFIEHRYRIIGRVRLALFWASRDVGGARLTWNSSGGTTAVALLMGSDPLLAPRHINQWGYVREEIGPQRADAFALRSLDSSDTAARAPIAPGRGPLFGLSCSTMSAELVNSAATKVDGRGVTYRMFGDLMNQIGTAQRWEARHTPRPAGADAGFLTALQRLLRIRHRDSKSIKSSAPATYVYNNTVYDLSVREQDDLGRTMVGERTFEQLTRTDLAIRNRTSSEVTKFAVTHVPGVDDVPLPVQIFYQPSFWLGVELRLDPAADVPADPAADRAMLERIRALCAGAAQ